MARILGVDEDTGARVCHGRWPVQAEPVDGLIPDGATLKTHDHLYMTDGGTRVLAEVDGTPLLLPMRSARAAVCTWPGLNTALSTPAC